MIECQCLLYGINNVVYPLWARSYGNMCLGEVYVNSLYLVFVLWWLLFALFHVKTQRTVQESEALESAVGMWDWLDATIVVDKVYYGCGCQDSSNRCQHVTKPIVRSHTGGAPKEQDVV